MQAARRYGPGGSFWAERPELPPRPVRAWQIWNEPNIKFYWPDGADPAAYVSMLRTVGSAIKSVDTGAEIVAAGLPESPGDGHMPLAEFITGMYNAGGKGAFDTMGVHPYASSADRSFNIVDMVRKLMDDHGDTGSSIWVTEIGWADNGPASPFTRGRRRPSRDDPPGLYRRSSPSVTGSSSRASSTTPCATRRRSVAARTSGGFTPACTRWTAAPSRHSRLTSNSTKPYRDQRWRMSSG